MTFHLDMNALLQTDPDGRDEEWEKAFLYLLPNSKLRILEEVPKQGPDGFPYLMVAIDDQGSEPSAKVLEWLSEKGIGMVINPFSELPDYVLNYGQIWNFRERGEVNSPIPASQTKVSGKFKIKPGEKVIAGEPTPEYLPQYVRNILREFFRQQKMTDVRITVLGVEGSYDLCFSLESLKNPPSGDHRDLLEAIAWFLPGHYSLALVSEAGLPAFVPL